MTWTDWCAARRYLYEERLGTHLRETEQAAERKRLLDEARTAAAYQRGVAEMKKRQQEALE